MTAVLRAEWTKFRTVRGWLIGLVVAASAIVAFGLFPGPQGSCGKNGPNSACGLPVGPDGGVVTDRFFFVHQPLAGDGSITVRVGSLTGLVPAESGNGRPSDTGNGRADDGRPGLVPWAKAGLILKADTRQGSAYAAVMLTGSHGVRMQYNYTHDIAGPSGSSPRWLRLTRTGDTVTGAESPDGTRWTTLGTAHLAGLPATVPAGLFATSPQYTAQTSGPLGGLGTMSGPSQATGGFDHLTRAGNWPEQPWVGDDIGESPNAPGFMRGGFSQSGEELTVTGSGDIAPAVDGAAGLGTTITQTLVGTFAGLIAIVIVAAMFVTAEYRRGLIRTTMAASPRRGRILVAKAIVVGAATYLAGLVSAAVVVPFGQRAIRANGGYVHPASTLTELRLVAGTAALLAVCAVLALAIGAMLRRSAAAIAAVIVVIVLPYLLAVSVLPATAAQWLLRVTPAAAFAVQQSAQQYPQVDNVYTPGAGYFPLAPWAGFAVLCAWAGLALALASFLLRRRDA
jgi:ABC-type transport system involved in multi-copper enzyme maturation permease subunit